MVIITGNTHLYRQPKVRNANRIKSDQFLSIFGSLLVEVDQIHISPVFCVNDNEVISPASQMHDHNRVQVRFLAWHIAALFIKNKDLKSCLHSRTGNSTLLVIE
jgi:hypothetical protein